MSTYQIKTKELFLDVPELLKSYFEACEYPWEILPYINILIKDFLETGLVGYVRLRDNILVGANVSIAPTATIVGPAIIGANTEIRPGAYLRENVIIGENCIIGNSSELKNSILLTNVQVPHFNYVGDSILGSNSHMGAGSICSNLRSDGKNVVIKADKVYQTDLQKVGSFLGDYADIGCGSVLNPGTIIGQNTQVYPLTMCRGAYPCNSIVKSTKIVVDKK